MKTTWLARLRALVYRLFRGQGAGILHASTTVLADPELTIEPEVKPGRAQKYKPPKNPNMLPDPRLGLKSWIYPQRAVQLQEVATGNLVPGSVSMDGRTLYAHTAAGWKKTNQGEKVSKKERRRMREHARSCAEAVERSRKNAPRPISSGETPQGGLDAQARPE